MSIDQALKFLERHRWRSLAEEKPTEDDANEFGEIDFWSPRWRACTDRFDAVEGSDYTHWRPITGPEGWEET